MELNFASVALAISTFLIIGICHPLVIKTEYYFGTKPWWIWLLCGLSCVVGALFVENNFISTLLAVFGATLLWGIGELFSQKKRVEKGWFPMNPKRKNEYKPLDRDETLCPVHKGKSIYSNEDSTYINRENNG